MAKVFIVTEVFIVLWSRTEGGDETIKGAFKTARQAEKYVKQMEGYEGGWFVVRPYKVEFESD